MTHVAELLTVMTGRFDAAAAADLELIFQFDISDGDNHFIAVANDACSLHAGDAKAPNVTLFMDTDTLAGITHGQLDGMQAFMEGKLRPEGDMALALKLAEIFP